MRVSTARRAESLTATRQPQWTRALLAIAALACLVVPCVFSTRLEAVFALPKLAVLWVSLALSLGVVAAGLSLTGMWPASGRLIVCVDAAVIAFVVVNLIAWTLSIDRKQSLYGEHLQYQGLLTLLLYVGFFYVARLAVGQMWELSRLLWATAVAAMLVSGYALVQRAGLDPIWHGYLPGGHVFSSIGQSNALAAYLVLTIPVALAVAAAATGWLRRLVLLGTAAMLAAFVFAESRAAYIGLAAAIVVLAVLCRRRAGWRSRRVMAAIVLVLVAVALAALARAPSVAREYRRVVSRSDSSVRFHLDAWRVSAEIAKDHPLAGTGPDTFPEVFPRYSHEVLPPKRADALDAFRVESPHNVYLAVATGSGIPALIAYVAIVVGFFGVVRAPLRAAAGERRLVLAALVAGASGHLVTDAFMTAEITSSWLFWLLLGASLGWISGER